MKAKATKPRKKPYRSPRLVAYGDLRTLTRTKKGTSSDGGGAKPSTRLSGLAA